MKKTLSTFIVAVYAMIAMTACGQHPSDVDFTILEDPILEGKFYPSMAIWNSTLEDNTDAFYSFYLNAPQAGDVIRITMQKTSLNEETIVQQVAESAGEMEIVPVIKWDYDKLSKLTQGGAVTMTCILEINGKEIDRINHVVKYRPINECIYCYYDEENDEVIDLSEMFALFVNEDYAQIDKILSEILAVDRDRSFVDYQGEGSDFIKQIYWVWEYFSNKGTRYSNIVNTSNVSEYIGLQHVRFIDEVINNNQANCVDGSCMLASIYRKIGLDVYLVLLPSHCMLAIYSPYGVNWGEDGVIDSENGGFLLMETTMMGNNVDPNESFDSALTAYNMEEMERLAQEEDFVFVNIEAARSIGILPITRNVRGGQRPQ